LPIVGAGRLTTAGAILDVLAAAGVRTAFGLPGVHNLPFWAALGPGRPTVLGVRHEQTAGYAADGLARASGGLGVAFTTTGPGAANVVAAFGEAAASGSPVLLVASEVPAALRRPGQQRGLLHEMADQAALFEPLAKAVYRPTSPLAAVEAVARAAAYAMSSPRGPVYVGVPADVLAAELPGELADGSHRLPAAAPADARTPSSADVEAALAELSRSRRPLLWVGGGAVQSGAADAVAELAGRLGAPVLTTYAARGVLRAGHPLLVDVPPHEPEAEAVLASADLVVALGTAFDGMTTKNWSLPSPPRLLAVNTQPAHLESGYPADVGVVADVGAFCAAVTVRLRGRDAWADAVFAVGPEARRRLAADPATADGIALAGAVSQAWTGGGLGPVVCDMAVAGYWVGGYATFEEPRRLQYPVGWGTLGYALPASVGAAAAGVGPVLVVCGDGGAAMGVGELATLVQERLPVTVLLVDDGGYGMLRFDQQTAGEPERGVDLVGPDWLALAGAYGIAAEVAPDTGPGLRAALERAAAAGEPRFVLLRSALKPPRTTSPRWAE
jgi:thiamine pyrophosphate-dependent acetolactate synthase large subunit-like protein